MGATRDIGSASGGTDQPVARNSPPFSIHESESSGSTTIFVAMAIPQATQNHTTASHACPHAGADAHADSGRPLTGSFR